ncbi:MAG: zf-HC2 domain-containing protein [Phycisphaerales bacterium]|nr:zf-HC2 domain-containing protein [Phycisphaerales bacterium]
MLPKDTNDVGQTGLGFKQYMNCEQSQNLFDAYLDNSLTGTLATEFGAHQLACSHCRRDLALLEVAGHVVASDNEAPLLDDEFTSRLVECATSKPAKRPLKFSRALWVGLPAALAACLTLVVLFGDKDAASNANDKEIAPPSVLGFNKEVTTLDELRANVNDALSLNPDNEELKKLAETLRERSEKIIGDTRDGASLLQDYSEDAIRELIRSVPNNTQTKPADAKGNNGSQDDAMQDRQNGSSNSRAAKPPTEEL